MKLTAKESVITYTLELDEHQLNSIINCLSHRTNIDPQTRTTIAGHTCVYDKLYCELVDLKNSTKKAGA